MDHALLLDARHLCGHTAHSKDGGAHALQIRSLAAERRHALMLQGRLEVLRVPKADAKQVLLGMRCLLKACDWCIKEVILNNYDYWLCPCCRWWEVET